MPSLRIDGWREQEGEENGQHARQRVMGTTSCRPTSGGWRLRTPSSRTRYSDRDHPSASPARARVGRDARVTVGAAAPVTVASEPR